MYILIVVLVVIMFFYTSRICASSLHGAHADLRIVPAVVYGLRKRALMVTDTALWGG